MTTQKSDNKHKSSPKIDSFRAISYHSIEDVIALCDGLASRGYHGYISPLHSPDEGEKVEHYHIVGYKDKGKKGIELTTFYNYLQSDDMNGIIANNHIEKCNFPIQAARYLEHLDNQDKQQFDITNGHLVVEWGDPIPYAEYIDTKEKVESKISRAEIYTDIIDLGMTSYAQLLGYYLQNDIDRFEWVAKHVSEINTFLRSASILINEHKEKAQQEIRNQQLLHDKDYYVNKYEDEKLMHSQASFERNFWENKAKDLEEKLKDANARIRAYEDPQLTF